MCGGEGSDLLNGHVYDCWPVSFCQNLSEQTFLLVFLFLCLYRDSYLCICNTPSEP